VTYLALHIPFLAPSLEDIDSINFALGLRAFNPALHQPHPPGYPVYMALGHLSLAIVERVTSMPRVSAEVWSLAVWSAIGGAGASSRRGSCLRRWLNDQVNIRPPTPNSQGVRRRVGR
jgi:hypothetical protein